MIQIQNLSKSYGSHVLLDGVSMQMSPRERLGLVGRNGHGKSTLFKIILGEEESDSGDITVPKNYKIGHLAQHLIFNEYTILDEACLGLPPDEQDDRYKAEIILNGLGFAEDDFYRAPSEFSGGYQIRLNLAKVLLSKPNLLLLDEPTNYLDIVSQRWIVNFLRAWPNEMIIISHDRDFMDQVTTHTAGIHRCKLRKIEGNTAKLYSQIIQEEEIHEKTRQNEQKKREQTEVFINRFRAKASKAASVQSRIKKLEKLPQLEKLSNIESLDFEFRHAPFSAKIAMTVEDLSFGYPDGELLIQDLNLTVNNGDRIAIIGKNGKGKSTLLNLLAGELTPTTGEVRMHPNITLGYFGQTNINRLHTANTIEKEISEANITLGRTQVRNICGTMMFDGDKAEKKISVLSGGEKSRVLLGKILATPSNMLFLDEPTNHLDMESIEALVESIDNYEGALIIVTHTEMILREIATKLIIFHQGKVEVFDGTYDEFLEKIGWEEEAGSPSSRKKKASAQQDNYEQKKESDKQQRKIKKAVESLEQDIMQLETELTKKTESLAKASEKSNVEQITSLSKAIRELEKQIESKFAELSSISGE